MNIMPMDETYVVSFIDVNDQHRVVLDGDTGLPYLCEHAAQKWAEGLVKYHHATNVQIRRLAVKEN